MKSSEVNKKKNELLADLVLQRQNRPGEYSAVLDPITAAQLEYAMKEKGFDSIEEVLLFFAPKLFEAAVMSSFLEKRSSGIIDEIHEMIKRNFLD